MLIERLRAERERLQAEIDRIVRELQIQIDQFNTKAPPDRTNQ